MYKLVAIDMDGTLLNSDHALTPRLISAVHEATQKGVHVVLASGRPTAGMLLTINELGLTSDDHYMLAYNGSLSLKVASQNVLRSRLLTAQDAVELQQLALQLGVNTHAFCTTNGLITPKHNKYAERESSVNNVPIKVLDYQQLSPQQAIIKVLLTGEPEHLDSVIDEIPKALYERYTIVRSAGIFLEFMHKGSGKGSAVQALTESLGLSREQVICIGDQGNDISMLEYAGLGVAMGNADREVKAIANYTTSDNDQYGVAQVLEKFILN
jgi:Cof subfamily protein (haloacid dehalogenase superfamily)